MIAAIVCGAIALAAGEAEPRRVGEGESVPAGVTRIAEPHRSSLARAIPPAIRLTPRVARLARRFDVRPDLAAVIYEQARLAGVEPAMAFGMIALESDFDPHAVGRQGERGLMQIKPSTARDYDRRVTANALHDPALNVRLGLRHLKREVEYFGDRTLGLMSYHMGRARLQRELADGVPPRDRYAERILSSCGPDCA